MTRIEPISLRRALRFVLGCACALLTAVQPAAADAIRIAFVGPAAGDAWHGARQGIAEANAQGRFLGLSYELAPTDRAGEVATDSVAVVVDATPTQLLTLAAALPELPVFNVGAGDDQLRATCRPNLLHTLPSDAMRAAAVAQWRQREPAATVSAQAWHPDFEKYAAVQLNRRYAEAAGRPMNDIAWAAWAAVKLLSDQLARQPDADRATLLAALRGPLAFDGQKGDDLSFRDTGQLRQPLLIVAAGELVGEAPVRGIADGLDSLDDGACAPAMP